MPPLEKKENFLVKIECISCKFNTTVQEIILYFGLNPFTLFFKGWGWGWGVSTNPLNPPPPLDPLMSLMGVVQIHTRPVQETSVRLYRTLYSLSNI